MSKETARRATVLMSLFVSMGPWLMASCSQHEVWIIRGSAGAECSAGGEGSAGEATSSAGGEPGSVGVRTISACEASSSLGGPSNCAGAGSSGGPSSSAGARSSCTCPVFDPTQPNRSFCFRQCPCARNEGDCDNDEECQTGLICDIDRGPHVGLPASYDVCRWKTRLLFWGQDAKAPTLLGNSLPAIENAYSLGYDGVEIDVRMTADARLILMHDAALEHTSTGTGEVASMTLEEVQRYQLLPEQDPPIAIPTLEEALTVNRSRGVFLADVKDGPAAVDALQLAIDTTRFPRELLLLSAYGVERAAAMKKALPWARVLVKRYVSPGDVTQEDIDAAVAAEAAGMMLEVPGNVASVEPLLASLHERGLILVLFVHYANRTFKELEAMAEMGVDYVLVVAERFLY
jgi:glycerophosphoryl diester phosphodiesterase